VDIYVSNAARRLYKDFFTITADDCDYLMAQLPNIVETVEEKLKNG